MIADVSVAHDFGPARRRPFASGRSEIPAAQACVSTVIARHRTLGGSR